MQLPPSETGHGVAVPFPFRDRSEYKSLHSNREINQRIRSAPIVDIPMKGLFSVQHSVKPKLVSYYIDHGGPMEGRVHPKTGTPQDYPIILQQNGVRWVYDGNHRTTAAYLRGEKSIQARFVNFDDDPGQPGSSSRSADAAVTKSPGSSSSSSSSSSS